MALLVPRTFFRVPRFLTNARSAFLPIGCLFDAAFDPNANPTFGVPCKSIGDYMEVVNIDSDVPLALWTGGFNEAENIIQGI
jgi:hypothetical protein